VRKDPLLLGITGAFGSGKSSASVFFATRGFTKIRLSDYLEKEVRKVESGTVTREMLQDMGNKMREEHGSGFLAEKALEHIAKEQLEHVVIDGIRTMGEVEALCLNPNFLLLAIVADRAVRFERLEKHPRREKLTLESFAKLDYRDLGVGEKDTGLQTGLCIALADVFVENNGSEKLFEEKLSQYLEGKTE